MYRLSCIIVQIVFFLLSSVRVIDSFVLIRADRWQNICSGLSNSSFSVSFFGLVLSTGNGYRFHDCHSVSHCPPPPAPPSTPTPTTPLPPPPPPPFFFCECVYVCAEKKCSKELHMVYYALWLSCHVEAILASGFTFGRKTYVSDSENCWRAFCSRDCFQWMDKKTTRWKTTVGNVTLWHDTPFTHASPPPACWIQTC